MEQNTTEKMHELEEGDKINVNTHNQTFTVVNTMFGGEIVDVEGPKGGEKGLVENLNSGSIAMMNGDTKEGTVTEINVR